MDLGLSYTRVSAFTYQSPQRVDRYTFLERSLGGDNFADYDKLVLTANLHPRVPGLRITPTLVVQRQGEGGVREPFPSFDGFRASPPIFLGTKETTYRLGLAGRYQPNRYFWITWDLGENFVRNKDHVAAENRTEFSGVAEFGISILLPKDK